MAKDAEVGHKTRSTIRSDKNLPLDMAKDAEVGGNNNGNDNKRVKKSPLLDQYIYKVFYFPKL